MQCTQGSGTYHGSPSGSVGARGERHGLWHGEGGMNCTRHAYLLRVLGRVRDVAVVVRGSTAVLFSVQSTKRMMQEDGTQGANTHRSFVCAPPHEMNVSDPGRQRRQKQTLQDASMLWIVTQTEMTLSTGDHSLPRMDAHICTARAVSYLQTRRQSCGGRAYMAI